MRRTFLLVLALVAAVGCDRPSPGGTRAPGTSSGPDVVVVNAKVFTADSSHPYAEALAIHSGRFVAVGTTDDVRRLAVSSTRIIDAGGRLVTPGLIEAHAHFDPPLPGRSIAPPDGRYPGLDAGQTLAAVAKATREGEGWISGTSDAAFEEPRNWRRALDKVAPRNPVVITNWTAHALVLNTAALEAQTLQRGAAAYARWGVTSVHHMADDLPVTKLRAALARAQLPIRWIVFAWGLGEVPVSEEWRRVDNDREAWPNRTRLGGLKWILDPTIQTPNSAASLPAR